GGADDMGAPGGLVDLGQGGTVLRLAALGARNQPRDRGDLAGLNPLEQFERGQFARHAGGYRHRSAPAICCCMSRNTARSSMTRRALKSVRGMEFGSTTSTRVRRPRTVSSLRST